jgi:hypothetical protein
MKLLYKDEWNPNGATALDSTKTRPLFQVLGLPTLTPENKASLVNTLTYYSKAGNTGMVNFLQSLDPNQYAKYAPVLNDPTKMKQIQNIASIQNGVASMNGDPLAVQNLVFGISDVTKNIPNELSSKTRFEKDFPIFGNAVIDLSGEAQKVVDNYFKSGQAAKDLQTEAAKILAVSPEAMIANGGKIPAIPNPIDLLRGKLATLLQPVAQRLTDQKNKIDAEVARRNTAAKEKTKADNKKAREEYGKKLKVDELEKEAQALKVLNAARSKLGLKPLKTYPRS